MIAPFGGKNTKHCKRHYKNTHLTGKRQVDWWKTFLKIKPKEMRFTEIRQCDQAIWRFVCNIIEMRFELAGEFKFSNSKLSKCMLVWKTYFIMRYL